MQYVMSRSHSPFLSSATVNESGMAVVENNSESIAGGARGNEKTKCAISACLVPVWAIPHAEQA